MSPVGPVPVSEGGGVGGLRLLATPIAAGVGGREVAVLLLGGVIGRHRLPKGEGSCFRKVRMSCEGEERERKEARISRNSFLMKRCVVLLSKKYMYAERTNVS